MKTATTTLLALLAPGLGACGDEPVAVDEGAPAVVGDPARSGDEARDEAREAVALEVQEREDGLVIDVFERGTGPAARASGEVLVHYRARVDGAEEDFDSSWSRGVPDRWRLSAAGRPRLIDGLRRALVGMRAGTRASVRVPAALGWGAEGFTAAGVGPDADLIYEVLVLEVR